MALFIKIIGWILVLIQLALFLIIMKEKDLWNYIEEEARRKLKLTKDWELRTVEILDDEIARVMLLDTRAILRRTESGLVVYAKKEEG